MTNMATKKRKLRTDPESYVGWGANTDLPTGIYDTAEITSTRIHLMLEGGDDVYVITILPGDDYGYHDAYVRRMGNTDTVHIPTLRARDAKDAVSAALELLPDYIGIV